MSGKPLKKNFNITGLCLSDRHYMVNTEDKLAQIKKLVDDGDYFIMNRSRQYGKTTTLRLLASYLKEEYIVIFLDFQKMDHTKFETGQTFSQAFAEYFVKTVNNRRNPVEGLDEGVLEKLRAGACTNPAFSQMELFGCLIDLCDTAEKPVVLMIDEVDSATNNQVFLDFLAQLRAYYLERDITPTFHSVILAGVHDIRNLKRKIRPNEDHRINSPWNIATPFTVDMSLAEKGIEGMLVEYEGEHHTGMDVGTVAKEIRDYTSGYPYLVSLICKTIDEELQGEEGRLKGSAAWSAEGVSEAVKRIAMRQNTLFDSLTKRIKDYPELRRILNIILFQGRSFSYTGLNESLRMAETLGFIKEKNGKAVIANRIFEIVLYNLFTSEEETQSLSYDAGSLMKNRFIGDGKLNMELILAKFVEHFHDVYSDKDEAFVEKQGRKLFLMYLKPIINGVGNYYVEAETRDALRTDIIVDYLGQKYVVELKIWHGEKYNEDGEKQLAEYLDRHRLKEGYLLTFNFNKQKETGVKRVPYEDKMLIEAMV